MTIKDLLTGEFPLDKKVDCWWDCYEVAKRRYLLFWEEQISHDNMLSILQSVKEQLNCYRANEWKTFIIVGSTCQQFTKQDLFFFDNVSNFAVFYLVENEQAKVYKNDDRVAFPLGMGYRKIVKKIDKIVQNALKDN